MVVKDGVNELLALEPPADLEWTITKVMKGLIDT
jgi:hypothetical protein